MGSPMFLNKNYLHSFLVKYRWACDPETFPKRIESNVGIYHTKKFQNKQALVSTKHCQVWQTMVITDHFFAEFGNFKPIARWILSNFGKLKLAETGKNFLTWLSLLVVLIHGQRQHVKLANTFQMKDFLNLTLSFD